MSLFGAMTTAISGLNAQSRSLGHISDNLANSQTTGFKRIDTNFQDLITQSSASSHSPGSVMARPDFTNTVQGTVEQSENPLGLAIGGQGFFSVAQARGAVDGLPIFDERQFYTRAGDFRMDRDGYLVNGGNYFLQGWPLDANGVVDRTTLEPVRVSQQVFNPIATSNIEISANIPAIPPPATAIDAKSFSTQIQVYDQVGTRHAVTLTFAQMTDGTPRGWNMTITPNPVAGGIDIPLIFGQNGRIESFDGLTGTPNTAVDYAFEMDFGLGNQPISLNLGRFNVAQGITQYAGKDFSLRNLSQNGVPPGAYSGLAVRENGDIAVNYDNGQFRIVARVPLVAFSDADNLQRLDGQGFMRTIESGEAQVTDVASNGVGKLVVGALEKSNVDIGTEFTKLIVAQRAYTANTKVVTAADEMLQDTINMKR
ncbi:flagellar hook protein FlgE [Sediminicoccus sp. KRV36]|uniref:flagellar hook protein FlgE n=1 Tax=Sediminicoccus sp. KRV36 TaxID=3133721 RepID=UPI00200C6370|nr:flagellar hook protein FlgE [Sediminicoccus rosea]UPY36841.1 flagellar hook protein FlgE [Sediminicoccus rosea]